MRHTIINGFIVILVHDITIQSTNRRRNHRMPQLRTHKGFEELRNPCEIRMRIAHLKERYMNGAASTLGQCFDLDRKIAQVMQGSNLIDIISVLANGCVQDTLII